MSFFLFQTARASDRAITFEDCQKKMATTYQKVEWDEKKRLKLPNLDRPISSDQIGTRVRIPLPERAKSQISQGYGGAFSHSEKTRFHAVDFAVPTCSPIASVAAGRVLDIKKNSKEGGRDEDDREHNNWIRIDHGQGKVGYYSHLCFDCVLVRPGELVNQGQIIGLSGQTGLAGVPHLHFNMGSFFKRQTLFQAFEEIRVRDGVPIKGEFVTSENEHRIRSGADFNGSETAFPQDFYLEKGVAELSPSLSWWKSLVPSKTVQLQGRVTNEFRDQHVRLFFRTDTGVSVAKSSKIEGVHFKIEFEVPSESSFDRMGYLTVFASKEKKGPFEEKLEWPIVIR